MSNSSLSLCLALSLCVLTGCSLTPTVTAPGSSNAVRIHGVVYGGQQPVVGGHVYLFTPNTTGNGGDGLAAAGTNASLSLLNSGVLTHNTGSSGIDGSLDYYVTSGAGGSFSITGDYSCTTGYAQTVGSATPVTLTGSEPVYLYAVGGDPGAGTNSAAGFMASLGPCNALTSSTSVFVDEVTTVALAYAAAGFATDATHISSSGSASAVIGMANAFANTTNLVNLSTGTALSSTPGTNGSVPQAELYTLANILAVCINSTGPTSPQCSGLLGAATSTGASSGAMPADTATAAINIAHHPGSNVSTLYNLPNGTYAFGGGLTGTTPPNDFTVALTLGGSGVALATGGQPHGLAVDGAGNAWVCPASNGALQVFTPLGISSVAAGFTGHDCFSVALDASSSNLWVTDPGFGTLIDYVISQSSASTYTGGGAVGIGGAFDAELDGSGNVWVADNGGNQVLEFNSSGTLIGGAITGNGLNLPLSLALQPGAAGNVWVTSSAATSVSVFTNAQAAFANDSYGSINFPYDIAIDSNGYAWTSNNDTSVSKLAPAGTSGVNYIAGATGASMESITIDGANHIWLTDQGNGTILEVGNDGTVLSPARGYLPPPSSNVIPDSIAVDGSGNVWYSSQSADAVIELIGAAAPTTVPIAYAVANSLLGSRP